jgi:hypothetical protein
MRHLVRHSSAVVIATAALVVAVTQTAFGGPTRSTSSVTPAQAKKIAKSVADAEITRLAPSLSVKSAETAVSAASAGSPALYAQVTGLGAVTTNSRGVVQQNVSHPKTGIYCFSGLASTPKGGVAILDALPPGASGADLAQVGVGTLAACPAGTQAVVGTFAPSGDLANDPFFVVFWS